MSQRPSLENPDDDPRLWLEDIEGPEATAWADARSAETMARFADALFERHRETLRTIYDAPDKIPYVTRRGGHVTNFWQDATHVRGVWRRTDLASFQATETRWDVILDLDTLADSEGENWVWHGAATLPGRHDRALVYLSPGGSDASVIREFDMEQRAFVPGGFALPVAKGHAAWLDRDTLLVATTHDEPTPTTSGYARRVRLWRRGTPFEDAETLFAVETTDMSAGMWVDRSVTPHRVWFLRQAGFFDQEVFLGSEGGAVTRIETPLDATLDIFRDWLTVHLRTPWTVGGITYVADSLLGIRLGAFLAGDRAFARLFEPAPRVALQGLHWSGETLVLEILDHLENAYVLVDPARDWAVTPFTDVPRLGVASLWPVDTEESERDGSQFLNIQDPLTPARLFLVEPGRAPALLKTAPAAFDPAGLTVSRHEAISTDGERIPYVQVGPAGASGDAPVLMWGYGGFAVSERPFYNPGAGKLWLEQGGTYVSTHLRGGGEFGRGWHDAGRGAGKALSHDDFAAIAADLVRRGVTVPRRIAAMGGSNGGILISNMLTRYPDRFGALWCTIPLIDMRRYSKLLAGASWIAEYGDPDKPEDWAHLARYSAYHAAIDPTRAYPSILIATTRKDDRVHPGHARKFCLKLQEAGLDAHYFEPAAGGHGAGKDNAERAIFNALGYRFLREKIGWL